MYPVICHLSGKVGGEIIAIWQQFAVHCGWTQYIDFGVSALELNPISYEFLTTWMQSMVALDTIFGLLL